MAKLTGINTRLSGTVGNWNFAQVGGTTIVKQKAAKKSNPTRTHAQMVRRTAWSNLVNLYQEFFGTLVCSFENRPSMVSDFNEFVGKNIDANRVYLTMQQAHEGGAVVAPYILTQGTLRPIVTNAVVVGTSEVITSNIALGTLTIDSDTTVKAFSDAVVAANSGIYYGDQISCYILSQTMNPENDTPYVSVEAFEVTLDTANDQTKLWDVAGQKGFTSRDGMLGLQGMVQGGAAYVLSRKRNGKVLVSSQKIVVTNSVLANYQSAAQRDKAILSYGGVLEEPFLTPNNEDTLAPQNP